MNIENALKIRGWMSEQELTFLAIIASQSKYIIEAGCFEGRSTRAMADNTTGKILAIDPWNCPIFSNGNGVTYSSDINTRHKFYANLYDKIKDNTVKMYPMKFTEFLNYNQFLSVNNFVFIDADHSYESTKKDIEHGLEFHPTIIAGHDYQKNWPGVIQAVDEIFPNSHKEDTIWWQKLR